MEKLPSFLLTFTDAGLKWVFLGSKTLKFLPGAVFQSKASF
jgi:hypothetical protein